MNPLATLLCLLSLVSLTTTAPGASQDNRADPEKRLNRALGKYDKNGDLRISREEFRGTERAFRRFDKDRNGFIDAHDIAGASADKTAPLEPVGAPTDKASLQFFEQRIRPVLEESCYRCHSSSGEKIKGGLLLDSRESMLLGGESGPALVPGDPDASPLVIAVRYVDEDLQMPPKRALPAEVVRDLEHWVQLGAPWTAEVQAEAAAPGATEIDIEAGREWWAFKKPQTPEIPDVDDQGWAWTDIDRFLYAAMEQKGLRPVGDADASIWLRRVSLDLTGLPPTPEELANFQGDRSDNRYAKVVDRMLASPRFGERWGRHWLDVARFAESSGRNANNLYPHAWRYRDYVIEAFDRDLPYNRFLAEQIAGDLMPAANPTERARLDIATGYLAIGSKSHTVRNPLQFAADLVDEQVDAMTQGMLAVTVSCARCHDHKFDPIPTEDYYALAGIFRSSETLYGTFRGNQNRHPADLIQLPEEANVSPGMPMDSTVMNYARGQQRRLRERVDRSGGQTKTQTAEEKRRELFRVRANRDSLATLDNLFQRFDGQGNPTRLNRVAMGMRDALASDMPLLIRGEITNVGPLVPRGVPQVLSATPVEIPENTSGRLQVAQWVASTENPLTARVWVNRVWLHLFGAALVTSTNNFGLSGQAPSHPQLLDWLAVSFMEQDGWSTKSLIRRITLSRAYRLACADNRSNHAIDPLAIHLWRMPERRLDAEAIRDSMLMVAGTLELRRPGGSIVNSMEGDPRREQVFKHLTRPSPHRSVYLASLRDRVPVAMEVFDGADPSFVTGDRSETSVATQALYLMNDDQVMAAADAFAERVLRERKSTAERIALAFTLALGREPAAREVSAVKSFLRDYSRLPHPQDNSYNPGRSRERRSEDQRATDAHLEVWSAFVQTLFQCAEFRYAG